MPLPDELINRRAEIARALGVKVDGLSKALKRMSEEERRAVFYKLTHEGPVNLTGTGLKPIVFRSERVTLAVPREKDLSPLEQKLEDFGAATPTPEGYLPNQDLARIADIEPGEPKDRLSDELFERYDDLVKQQDVICEIELLSLQQGRRQQRAEIAAILEELVGAFAGGTNGSLFEHEENKGSCRAVIRCRGKFFKELVEGKNWQTKISWFEPRPRFETFHTILKNFHVNNLGAIESPPEDAPVVCVVDSGVTAGNPFLEPVTLDDMSHSFLKSKPDNPFDEYGHGSGVASLAAYYALNLEKGAANPAKVWVASARILNDQNQVEDERLFSKVLGEVVEKFAPLGVRIFNLSVGDVAKKWNPTTRRTARRDSWVARTIDRLSREYDVIFVTCTGNLFDEDVRDYVTNGVEYPRYLLEEDARILDPGQAALALTVGSIAATTLTVATGNTAIAEANQPAPYTRSGPGMRRETKPELVELDGNLVYDSDGRWVRDNPGSNVVMASHKLTPAVVHQNGTSFAAPRVSHKLALVLKDLADLGLGNVSAPLLKAFLVNSARYRGDAELVEDVQAKLHAEEPKSWLHVLGYGFPDHLRATDCDDYSMILYHQGELEANRVAYFDVPIPSVLAGAPGHNRITVTVVHYPEVQQWGLERYLGTDLKWRMFRGDVSRDDVIAAMSVDEFAADEDEAEDVGLPNELKFNNGIQRRSRGTVQHDVYEWTQHRGQYSESHYTLAIAAYKRWQRQVEPVPFAIVLRVEDLGRTARVYAEIAQLLAEIEVEARG